MKFTKMQGAGNDFIIIDNRAGIIARQNYSRISERLCSRRLSLGADGIMFIEAPSGGGCFKMVFYNNDGTEGEMCGNGARCISRWGYERGLSDGSVVRVETASGTVVGERRSERQYTVRLNSPSVIDLHREVLGLDVSYVELGIPGHPHCVVPYSGLAEADREELSKLGSSLRWYKGFPKGANVTFCEVTGENEVRALTFERGVENFTLACGTGSGSTALALRLRGLVSGNDTKITVPGGDLFVTVSPENGGWGIYLTGPTTMVAEGEILDEDL
ncbi:MAG: diaminopimelate epimerase [Oscillospiraceae bacterium]|nr:diaminopimelate epimerase [Oscillospiraceae bacterium]